MYRKGQDPNQTRGGERKERASVGLLDKICHVVLCKIQGLLMRLPDGLAGSLDQLVV
jgi:hypothetical protein